MQFAPIARIILRYGVGFVVGRAIGDDLAADPDVVMFTAMGVGAAVEIVYTWAKRKGRPT